MNQLQNCQRGSHNLKTIYINYHWDCEEVVRWCEYCGAIVIDNDYDHRTNAGQIMKMKLPQIFINTKKY